MSDGNTTRDKADAWETAKLADSASMVTALPEGTVTFLFTDVEKSTQLAQRFGDEYAPIMASHFAIIDEAVAANGGVEVKNTGDGLFAVFLGAPSAVRAARSIQEGIARFPWPDGGEVRVRVGVHTGEATVVDDDYVGVDVHRAARVMAAAHGGQVVSTEITHLLAGDSFEFRSLGNHLLKGLESEEAVYQLVIPDLPSDFPPLNTASATPNNLPTRASTIIGRDDDIEKLSGLIQDHRLVTILGPGGVGKTSLAVTTGSRVIDDFPGGVTFVDLSAVTDPTFVMPSVATELKVEPRTVEGLAERLGDKRTLLLLDNFEQVVGAASDVARLMTVTDDTRLLVTSQVPLRLPEEQRYQLGTLETNGSDDSAGVRLFFDRALAADPSFDADPEDVTELVRYLDGLPLAIELAAARANLLSPAEILERLERGKTTFSASPASPDRHRSLDAALQWSYELLDEPTRAVYRRLGVFASDMSLTAAEEIVGGEDPFSSIAELVDRSLLIREAGAASRFRMLDGIRRHARRLLDESDEGALVRTRFVDHYRAIASEAYGGLESDREEWWRSLLDDELDNMREVLSILHSGNEGAEGLELLGNTWRFYQSRGHLLEFDLWLERFFDLPGDIPNGEGLVKGIMARGAVQYWREEHDEALAAYTEALDLAQQLEDQSLIADAIYGKATSMILTGQEGEAVAVFEDLKKLYVEMGDDAGLADVIAGESFVALNANGLQGLGPAFEKVGELYTRAGRRVQATQAVYAQTAVAVAEGRLEEALDMARRGIATGVDLADLFLQVWGLEWVATVVLELGNHELAGTLAGAAESGRAVIGGGWGPGIVGLDDAQTVLKARLGPGEAQRLIDPGRLLMLHEAVQLALGEDAA